MTFAHKEVSKYMGQCIQHLPTYFPYFDNVSINSEGSSEDISVSSQDEWDDGDTDETTDNIIKVISSKFNILQMTGDKTIVIDKNDVVT